MRIAEDRDNPGARWRYTASSRGPPWMRVGDLSREDCTFLDAASSLYLLPLRKTGRANPFLVTT